MVKREGNMNESKGFQSLKSLKSIRDTHKMMRQEFSKLRTFRSQKSLSKRAGGGPSSISGMGSLPRQSVKKEDSFEISEIEESEDLSGDNDNDDGSDSLNSNTNINEDDDEDEDLNSNDNDNDEDDDIEDEQESRNSND